MSLTIKEFKQIRKELDDCARPLFLFDSDSDGLAAFILLYRYKKEGKGVVVKGRPRVDGRFANIIREYQPDKIFILDISAIEDDFVDACKGTPIICLDHHQLVQRPGVTFYNPRVGDNKSIPTAQIAYHTVEQDLWIAAVGFIGDWTLPPIAKQLSEAYPDLLPAEVDRPEVALFDTRFGKLIRIYQFLLKGSTKDVLKCVKILTRIDSPYELFENKTPQAKYVMKRYKQIEVKYLKLLDGALKNKRGNKFIVFTYTENEWSFTAELSNELLYRNPDSVLIIGREKSGEMKCSLRSGTDFNIEQALQKIFTKLDGYGGGHEKACGACVKKEDFETFVSMMEEMVDEGTKKN